MIIVKEFPHCTLIQEYSHLAGVDVYRVMSRNNICLATDTRLLKAYQYCEWFEERRGRVES
jgi:hypothetical protein